MDQKRVYGRWVRLWRLRHLLDKDWAMQQAVGGEFEAMGKLEEQLLIQYGLQKDNYVVDVGCGSGRLAKPLSTYLTGAYLGIDIVPGLTAYAARIVQRPDWRFEVVDDCVIPEKDEAADFVCFFSVLTHLRHEQSYLYLKEAKRVLKPEGKIVFSFLEFDIPSHWAVFETTLSSIRRDLPLNVFLGREAIRTWSSHLGFRIVAIHEGNKPFIRIAEPIRLESGEVLRELGSLGQSVCVLMKEQ